MSTSRDVLLSEIDKFIARTGMTEPSFGKRTMNDHRFIKRLRAGASCSLDTADRLRSFMREYGNGPLARHRRRSDGVAA